MTADPALGFWLRWAERAGALYEPGDDVTLVLLPAAVGAEAGLAAEVVVTADPVVAREDGAVLLAPGHPALAVATDEVLGRGDGGHLTLVAPARPLDGDSLLARARAAFPIDHGRVDLLAAPEPEMLPVLRVGALVTYAVALDQRFQERIEAWLAVPGLVPLAGEIVERLDAASRAGTPCGNPLPANLAEAIAAAHRRLEAMAAAREAALVGEVAAARAAELGRTTAYYEVTLAALQQRRESAQPERRPAYDAKVEATRAERARRLGEIEEKFRPSREIRPYRLHLVWVPALRLPAVVRRGSREYPLTIRWLSPVRDFLPVPCPACSEQQPLVATKERLGCTACARPAHPAPRPEPVPPVRSVPPAREPPTAQAAAPGQPAAKPRSARPRRVNAAAAGSDRVSGDAGNKLAMRFWQAVASGDRKLSRMLAPDSPAATLHRLYGAAGPAWAVGAEPGEILRSVTATTVSLAGSTIAYGAVETSRCQRPYTLRLLPAAPRPVVCEVVPFPGAAGPRPRLPFIPFSRVAHLPDPRVELDPTAARLWRMRLPGAALALVLRCLTAWGRVADQVAFTGQQPATVAAAIAFLVSRRAGTQPTYAQVATSFGADEAAVRQLTVDLKKALRWSADSCW